MRRARPDPIIAALSRALQGCTPAPLMVAEADSRPWASATFSGAVHHLLVVVGGPDAGDHAERLIETLPEHEFALHGHVVADVSASRCNGPADYVQLRIEVLTVEE